MSSNPPSQKCKYFWRPETMSTWFYNSKDRNLIIARIIHLHPIKLHGSLGKSKLTFFLPYQTPGGVSLQATRWQGAQLFYNILTLWSDKLSTWRNNSKIFELFDVFEFFFKTKKVQSTKAIKYCVIIKLIKMIIHHWSPDHSHSVTV